MLLRLATAPPPTPHGWPLHDNAATRALEAQLGAQLPPHTLMQRAGQAVARLARALAPHAHTCWLACGPGNNGGDGLQAAACLARARWPQRVLVSCVRDGAHMPPDAQAAWQAARAAGVQWVDDMPRELAADDVCIDALLGIGARGGQSADARLLHLLHTVRASACTRLCVDVPSGLDAQGGDWLAPFAPPDATAAPGACHTLSLLTLHPGLFTGHGRDACGTVWWDDLGAGRHPHTPCAHLFAPHPAHIARLRRSTQPHASHKGRFGDVAILGGEALARRGIGMGGAAWLAALGALHGGAGRVLLTLLHGPAAQSGVQEAIAPWPEIMLRAPQAQDWSRATVVCGCGGGASVAAWLPHLLAQAPRLVLDADALNAIAADGALAAALRARRACGQESVLTPHPLEAARLLRTTTAQVQNQRLHAARELARQFACTVLLKGSGSITASSAGENQEITCWINPGGNARLATAGTGDVLAGLLAAFWAQGLPAAQAAAHAAWCHGAAADQWRAPQTLTASALARALPSVL